MDLTIYPKTLTGSVSAIPSKSQAHRLLICSAFADRPTKLLCPDTNQDIEATADCLKALGVRIHRTDMGYSVIPAAQIPKCAHLNCRESGSTLRFLLPLAGALGVDTTFHMEGRLPKRPLSPLWEEMERMGCSLSRPTPDAIRCQGTLNAGTYQIPGNISSQYITGLLLSLIHLKDDSSIEILGTLESRPYVEMTLRAMEIFGIHTTPQKIPGGQAFHAPDSVAVEGDWSNAAFFLAACALGNSVQISGLETNSPQGDRAVAALLPMLEKQTIISAADIPDLIPILSVVAACKRGAVFTDIQRLRLKESDRVASILAMLEALGGKAEATETTLTVFGTGLLGGTVDSANDHRIAMSAAVAATVCKHPVTILGAECVSKSYPKFFDEYRRLGGYYEQYLR